MQNVSFKSSGQVSHVVNFDNSFISSLEAFMTVGIVCQFEHLLFYAFRNAKTLSRIVRIPIVNEFFPPHELNIKKFHYLHGFPVFQKTILFLKQEFANLRPLLILAVSFFELVLIIIRHLRWSKSVDIDFIKHTRLSGLIILFAFTKKPGKSIRNHVLFP